MSRLGPPDSGRTAESAASRRRWLQMVGIIVGFALLAAAVVVVARQHETIGQALNAIRRPAAGQVCLLLGSVFANVALTGLFFSVLISRYGKVGILEMQALMAAATLMNFLPLRPGLFGRIAYHRASNAIPAAASVRAIVQAALMSVLVAGYLAAALVVSDRLAVPLWLAVALPFPLLAAGTVPRSGRTWCAAGLIRYVEVMIWSLRYHAAFSLIGAPIGADRALAFACFSLVAMLVPFVGNGLGVREWAIGLAAPRLTPYVLELGLAADLVNRAAELVVIPILGLAGVGWLAYRRRS
ncbi:MAG: hypothetical protein ACYS0G_14680 [Planctomycetota bacterium]